MRGYGRWQVPLSIDGIRVYLPADNRLDFNRFLTQDLAEIQIRKGYASVLDGPGGLGGAINLVTRKPTKAFESSFQSGAMFGKGTTKAGAARAASAPGRTITTCRSAAAIWTATTGSLSDDFRPTAIENGGERDRSDNATGV